MCVTYLYNLLMLIVLNSEQNDECIDFQIMSVFIFLIISKNLQKKKKNKEYRNVYETSVY